MQINPAPKKSPFTCCWILPRKNSILKNTRMYFDSVHWRLSYYFAFIFLWETLSNVNGKSFRGVWFYNSNTHAQYYAIVYFCVFPAAISEISEHWSKWYYFGVAVEWSYLRLHFKYAYVQCNKSIKLYFFCCYYCFTVGTHTHKD